MHRTLSLIACLATCSALAIAQDVSSQPTSAAAQVRLGNDYLADHDYTQAMIWFRKAADQGDAGAQNNVGWLYEGGLGVKQDYVEALTWFQRSAQQNNAEAQNNIGWLYHNGWGVKPDYGEAMTWYRKAASQGNARAQANIGWLYEKGFGVGQDYAEAMRWYRQSAERGNINAKVNIGWLYQNGWGVKQDYPEALTWYLEAADKGNAQGQNDVGWLYEKGFGVNQDYAQAMAWYYRAAEQGNAMAQNNLGTFYRDGLGDKQDYGKALTWFRKAADQGYAKAETNIGWLYENGLGIAQDYAQAMTWYRKAADQNHAVAERDIGWLYQNGWGVKQDYSEAVAWYRKAADQNDADAQNNLGWLYQNGFGVAQDYSQAMNWYRKAAAQDNSRAKVNLEWLSKNGSATNSAHGVIASVDADKDSGGGVMMPNGIRAPRLIFSPDPEYSEPARKAGTTGEVFLSVVVGPDGLPRDIKVTSSLGDGLDEKAVDAVKTWKFAAGTKDGKAVSVQLGIEIAFRLYGSSGIGKVDVVGDDQGAHFASYLSPIIVSAGKCWDKLTDTGAKTSSKTQDKTNSPSIKQGQVTIQFVLDKDGRVGATDVASSSGDEVLDREARDCVSALKTDAPWPPERKEPRDLTVHVHLLYNSGVIALTPNRVQIRPGGREQFYVEMAGTVSKAADWSISGIGCAATACGTISTDGLYTAPDVLPTPAMVRVKATLAGANPIAATALVTLLEKR